MRGLSIKRGDAYNIPVPVTVRGLPLGAEDVEKAVFSVGEAFTLTYPGAVGYEDGRFSLPLTQALSLGLEAGRQYPLDVRVKLVTGDVLGCQDPPVLSVTDAENTEVL